MALEVIKGGKTQTDRPHIWNPIGEHKGEHFYCERLGMDDLVLTPDILDICGRYQYNVKSARNPGRVYPVYGEEIVLSESREAKKAQITSDGKFKINLANQPQIKDFLVVKFIPSFPWQSTEEKSSEQVRDAMLSLAKQPRAGLVRQIEDERMQGYFLDTSTFIERMGKKVDNFPWSKFSDHLDFSLPIT